MLDHNCRFLSAQAVETIIATKVEETKQRLYTRVISLLKRFHDIDENMFDGISYE